MKAKKKLGQHFLINAEIAKKIVLSLHDPALCPYLIEVGPGQGALTDHLVSLKNRKLILIEKDERLIPRISSTFINCTVVHGDILLIDLNKLIPTSKAAIIGNFPYNISSQIIFKIIDNYPLIVEMVGMFQREMAKRICADPGSKDYGIISVLTQAKYDCKLLFEVSKQNFNPMPKVESAVIHLQIKEDPYILHSHPRFKSIVKQSFGMRRKMLKNSLKGLFPPEILEQDLIFKERPERLSLYDFYTITDLSLKHN